jgi:NTP pyrophosphatase (non-canonical NTP hydrolase)
MNDVEKEILLISQEECAEVTQAISKCFRFKFDSEFSGRTNRQRLEEEVGDLLCMIQLMQDYKLIDSVSVEAAKKAKLQKLAEWSNILGD